MAEHEGGANRGKWMALTAAFLGWLFDGLEMGLFPLVARPALQDLLGTKDDGQVGLWLGVMTAGFLVGAATGGVLFGWLGDRIGRVRAMTLSVLFYTLFTGLCGVAGDVYQVFLFRFIASLGMGGEWSLGVSLVMEIWPNRSRAWLAGLIGAASNVGFMLIAIISLGLTQTIGALENGLHAIGLPEAWVASLVAHNGWRLLMIVEALPALLTFLIRLFVPESERWLQERARGSTSHWAARDLLGVLIGACGALFIVYLWAQEHPPALRIVGSLLGFAVAVAGYLYPVMRYLARSGTAGGLPRDSYKEPLKRMLIGACLSGVALIGTWASVQQVPTWADQLTGGTMPQAKAYTQIAGGSGAILGTIAAALFGNWIGRRWSYTVLCLGSLGSALLLFQGNTSFGWQFLLCMFLAGALTASFYGWLPLYLPELFSTRVRAMGQGFAFNFGRILAAIAALQAGYLTKDVFGGNYPQACSIMSLVYLVGVVLIWFAPETHGKPLPD